MKSSSSALILQAHLIAASLLVGSSVAQAQTSHTLSITESGESPTPIVTFDGSPVTLDPSSTLFKDNWTIVLPSTFALTPLGEVLLGEPENAAQVNSLLVGTQPTTITWESDISLPAGVGAVSSSRTLPDAGVFFVNPNSPELFNLTLIDEPSRDVPETSSTAVLLGLSILGLWGASRIRSARA